MTRSPIIIINSTQILVQGNTTEDLIEALETINTRFPPEEWLHIYTAGSLLDFAQGAGIGVFSHLFSCYLHAGPLTTHFDGEVEAINIVLQQLAVRLPPIERARTPGKDKRKDRLSMGTIPLCVWGNERADFLAKKGTGILQNFRRDLTLHSAKLEIKRIFRESFRLTASRVARDKPWSTLLTSPICVLCDTGQDMTAAHLDECSALNDLNCIPNPAFLKLCQGCGSPGIKVSDHDRRVMNSSPVPLKTRSEGERSTLKLSRAQTSSH
ncbi:uncharacterized protein LOC103524116 [Trichonephila clavipes]|nr:uncharacterized protein LOC103524116 [Trichonephila clavipes]